jgi:selenocysteine lyase/cysteine desulfurase
MSVVDMRSVQGRLPLVNERIGRTLVDCAIECGGDPGTHPLRSSTPLEERDLDLVVRSSVHYFNTEQELQQLADAVQQLTR